ncbi:MAG TPA: hypothetical protein DCM40_27045 [Maribacter sp.]|nr:hypothetical protein [Maribacter sp.]|tara:strand:+ start:704 stop:1471 length:768 start_codon:yes stop_codon:yes gene_type:complete
MKTPLKNELSHKSTLPLLKKIIPKQSVVSSFLFFDGYVEFGLCSNDIFINATTSKYVIYEFWSCMIEDSRNVYEIAKSKSIQKLRNKESFHILQENWPKCRDPFTRSALFFMLNRCSDTGLISSGKFDLSRLNSISINYLKDFRANNFHLNYNKGKSLDFKSSKHLQSDFLLLPMGKFSYNLFEHGKSLGLEETSVHHRNLFTNLNKINKKWILIYKMHPSVFQVYKQYKINMVDKYGNSTIDKSNCEDIIVTNF